MEDDESMPGDSDALNGKVSERALEALEVFTRHGGVNEDDLKGWREFIVRTFLDGKSAPRDALRKHLLATRPDDGQETTEQWLDEYEEAFKLLKVYERLAHRSRDEN